MLKLITLIFYMSVFTPVSLCSGIPALIWSPTRSFLDLPDVYAGHTTSSADFHSQFLSPIINSGPATLVVFIQDRLTLEDLSHYADIYNPSGDGGAFKHVKSFLDEQFSVQLPAVKSPALSIQRIHNQFTGNVFELKSLAEMESLSLDNEQSNLLLVTLPVIKEGREEESFMKSDKLIGEALSKLAEMEVKYTALYTALASNQNTVADSPLIFHGRRLLAEPMSDNFTFVNVSGCLFMYSSKITVRVENGTNAQGKPTYEEVQLPYEPVSTDGSECFPNATTNSSKLVLNYSGKVFNMTDVVITMLINVTRQQWSVRSMTMAYTNDSVGGEIEFEMVPTNYDWIITAPVGMSYHCTQLQPLYEKYDANKTSHTSLMLLFEKFQLQPYKIINRQFSQSWDCVGFFTIEIWMGLIGSLLLLLVLGYGLAMMLTIGVMDKFDDPKSKTITINTGD